MTNARKFSELRQALGACRGYFWSVGLFSAAINILYLASPLYMLQVYDRVVSSGSVPTLLMLTVALLIALGAMAALDWVRSRILIRAGLRFDASRAGDGPPDRQHGRHEPVDIEPARVVVVLQLDLWWQRILEPILNVHLADDQHFFAILPKPPFLDVATHALEVLLAHSRLLLGAEQFPY